MELRIKWDPISACFPFCKVGFKLTPKAQSLKIKWRVNLYEALGSSDTQLILSSNVHSLN